MEKGLFVPDHLVDGLVAEELKNLQEDAKVILDGYPRTKQQAEFLIDYLKSGSKGKSFAVLSLEIDKETLVGRLLNRKVCNNKSCQLVMCKDDSECKKCGGELIIRVDDNLEAIETRQSDF
jgi:adenylate kinase